MDNQRLLIRIKKFQALFLLCSLLFPLTLHASFIEATMGAAVVNDATAVYYNPAALVLLKNPQIITLNSFARFVISLQVNLYNLIRVLLNLVVLSHKPIIICLHYILAYRRQIKLQLD